MAAIATGSQARRSRDPTPRRPGVGLGWKWAGSRIGIHVSIPERMTVRQGKSRWAGRFTARALPRTALETLGGAPLIGPGYRSSTQRSARPAARIVLTSSSVVIWPNPTVGTPASLRARSA